jgi:hypothetical protein
VFAILYLVRGALWVGSSLLFVYAVGFGICYDLSYDNPTETKCFGAVFSVIFLALADYIIVESVLMNFNADTTTVLLISSIMSLHSNTMSNYLGD